MCNLIGIAGFSRSGKDTVADILSSEYGYQKIDMSDSLKKTLADVYDISRGTWDNEYTREYPCSNLGNKTMRDALMYFGESFNQFYPLTWVNSMEKSIRKELFKGNKVCVPGIRRPHQVHMITELGGKVIYVHRPSIIPSVVTNMVSVVGVNQVSRKLLELIGKFDPTVKKFAHTSEFSVWDVKKLCGDLIIYNTDDIRYLAQQVNTLITKLS